MEKFDETLSTIQGKPNSVEHMASDPPERPTRATARSLTFWQQRLYEGGLILSLLLFYLIGNQQTGLGLFPAAPPLLAFLFLAIFTLLSWFRLSVAITLFPITFPFYLPYYQKVIEIGHSKLSFSLAEITLGILFGIAIIQVLLYKENRNLATLRLLWERIKPFLLPTLLFLFAACMSLTTALQKHYATVDLRKEVLFPLLYAILALLFLRTRQDLKRLLLALSGIGLCIAVMGIIQFTFFKETMVREAEGFRIHTVYGNANSIGLLLDYTLPLLLAWLFSKKNTWLARLSLLVCCVLMLIALYLTQSLGAWLAIGVALLFCGACALPNRRALLICAIAFGAALALLLLIYHQALLSYVFERHNSHIGVGTAEKRIYLWQTAWNMIRDHFWFGVGLDNWLCHYSRNSICELPTYHYWILRDPLTGKLTGLSDEPTLSHPHNVFLHVWVSMGIFGLLAFLGLLVQFFRTFIRGLLAVHKTRDIELRWQLVGVAGAMLAAMTQGLIDSAFLEQDLSYCFWTLIVAMGILFVFARGRLIQPATA